jgi:hypothetical protein
VFFRGVFFRGLARVCPWLQINTDNTDGTYADNLAMPLHVHEPAGRRGQNPSVRLFLLIRVIPCFSVACFSVACSSVAAGA